MYFKDYLKKFDNQKIRLFVDMDGVIVDYVVNDLDYSNKRPLLTNIKKIEEVSKMDNVEVFILSVSRTDKGVKQKLDWLSKYASFIKGENIIIISRETNNMDTNYKLKTKFLKNLNRDGSIIIMLDDDPKILKDIAKESKDVVLLKDCVLVD